MHSANDTPVQIPAYPLRMPPDMRIRLADQARINHRSLNGEILARLESTMAGVAPLADSHMAALYRVNSSPALKEVTK